MLENHKIIDVWMQHPNQTFLNHSMFDSLGRWTKAQELTEELPLKYTITAMDQAKVGLGLFCA